MEDITPETLTELFKQSGLLSRGRVSDIDWQGKAGEPIGKPHQLYYLTIHYSGLVSEAPPERLFLKSGKSRKETFFYTVIAPAVHIPVLMHCYYAGYDQCNDQNLLLLEDLSTSHFQPEWPLPPPIDLCEQTVDRLAEIQAGFWQHPCLKDAFRPALPPGRSWHDRYALAAEKLPEFLGYLGDRLSPERQALYRRILAANDQLWDTLPGSRGQTLLHGDMHFWNVLYPRKSGKDSLRIFDWNMWDIGRPTDDLAYMLALHWYPERRRRFERELLARYYRKLVEAGVYDYPTTSFWRDYQISAIRCLFIPVWQWVRGIHPDIWWNHMERGFLAFEDLGCEEFL